MRLGALRKLIFAVHDMQEMVFRLAKKMSVYRLNFKTKFVDNIPKQCVVGPWTGHRTISINLPNSD